MLVDEGDKLNQMAPFPVVPVYSPHALMKTLRLAQRHVYMFVCVHVCVCQPRLTSCCKLLPVDSGVFFVRLYVARQRSLPLGSTLVLFGVQVNVRVCVQACVHLYVVSVSYCSSLEPTTLST